MENMYVAEELKHLQIVKDALVLSGHKESGAITLSSQNFKTINDDTYSEYLTNRNQAITKGEKATPSKSITKVFKQTINSSHFDFNHFGTKLFEFIIETGSYDGLVQVLTNSLDLIPDQDICSLLLLILKAGSDQIPTETVTQLSQETAELRGILECLESLKGKNCSEKQLSDIAFKVYLLFIILKNSISPNTVKTIFRDAESNYIRALLELLYVLFEVLSVFAEIGEEQGQRSNAVNFVSAIIDTIVQRQEPAKKYGEVLARLSDLCVTGIYEDESATQIESILEAYDAFNFKSLAKQASKRGKKIKYEEFRF